MSRFNALYFCYENKVKLKSYYMDKLIIYVIHVSPQKGSATTGHH